jgi:hypothetical protein
VRTPPAPREGAALRESWRPASEKVTLLGESLHRPARVVGSAEGLAERLSAVDERPPR